MPASTSDLWLRLAALRERCDVTLELFALGAGPDLKQHCRLTVRHRGVSRTPPVVVEGEDSDSVLQRGLDRAEEAGWDRYAPV